MSEIINNIVKGDIGNALHSVASTHIVTTADEIYDETKQDRQSTINANVDAAIGSDSNPNTIKGRLAAIEARDVTTATYNSTDKTIEFYNVYNTKVAEIDATDFIKDGMVDTVAIVDNNLVITFNTDSGKQSISIPLTSFFDPSQYYNKTDINKLICDVSVLNVVNNQPKTYSSLSDAINDIPTNSRKGGMTLKFINDNDEYEQWSLITDTWSAVISNWRNADDVIRINTAQDLTDAQKATALGNLGISGIDDVPTAGSSNLLKSSGVYDAIVKKLDADSNYISSIKDNTDGLYITDVSGNIIAAIDENGIHCKNYIVHDDDNVEHNLYHLISDLNGLAVKKVEQELTDEEKRQVRENINAVDADIIKDTDSYSREAFSIIDGNGNVIAQFNNNGLSVNKIITYRSKFIICDDNNNISFRVNDDGTCDLVLNDYSINRIIDKMLDTTPVDFYAVSPSELFRVVNVIYFNRQYAPTLFAERMQIDGNQLLFNGGSPTWMIANKQSNIFEGGIEDSIIANKVTQDKFHQHEFNFILHSIKNSVFYEKNLRFLPLGDSITEQNNWHTYIRKLLLMDNVDWQIANNSEDIKYDMQTIGTLRNVSNTSFNYRNKNVDISYNYAEGRSSWSAVSYLRHAENYTWASVSYNNTTKTILHVAWRVLGLYELYGIEYNNSRLHKEYIRTTCNNQYSITTSCIDGFVWNYYRNRIGYNNIEFLNATEEQKNNLITYLTVTLLDNPINPFYDKETVNTTKGTNNCYAFNWNVYYERYKTHNENGQELSTKGTKATNAMHVCVPNIVGICLGTNDSVYDSEDTIVNIQDVYKIAELIQSSINAAVIVFANGLTDSMNIANYNLAGKNAKLSKALYYQNKNEQLKELCGDYLQQINKKIFYAPCFYVQGFGNYNDQPLVDLYTEKEIGSIITYDNIHPSDYCTSQWSYQIYGLIGYLITKQIV